MDELSNMLENAPQEEELHATEKELSPEFIEKVAMDALDKATEECPDPLVHKVMAMTVIHRMIDWHKHVAIRQLEEGNQASMGAWMRDAGKFQALLQLVHGHLAYQRLSFLMFYQCNWS